MRVEPHNTSCFARTGVLAAFTLVVASTSGCWLGTDHNAAAGGGSADGTPTVTAPQSASPSSIRAAHCPEYVPASAAEPHPLATCLDVAMPAVSGRVVAVRAGEDLQRRLDEARPGDVLELQAGATFTGNFVLPAFSGAGWVIVRSSAHASLAEGRRVGPGDAAAMPKLVTPNSMPALGTARGAHGWRLVGLEITGANDTTAWTVYNLTLLGFPYDGNPVSASEMPSDIVVDRCYIHGQPSGNYRRGVTLNSARSAVIDSYIASIKEVGADSQAIGGWEGPGPYKIVNNHLEGAGENVMFGGAAGRLANVIPSDIEIRQNTLSKPWSWRIEDPSYAGIAWSVKNLFELKNARRVFFEGNILENNWAHAQVGFAVVITVRDEVGSQTTSAVEDLVFRRNIVRHSGSGINIHSGDPLSLPTARVLIQDNLLYDIGTRYGGDARLFQLLKHHGTSRDLIIENNTALHESDGVGTFLVYGDTAIVADRMVFRANVVSYGAYGAFGSGSGPGTRSLDYFFGTYVFERNGIIGSSAGSVYPADNLFAAAARFVDAAAGNYRLAADTPFAPLAAGGRPIGADLDRIDRAVRGLQ